MSEIKWTEGEWRVVERVTNEVNGFEICWSDDGEAVTDHVYKEADAHVMAASKELYEALNNLSGWIVENLKKDQFDKAYELGCDAEKALAKARGEKQ